MRQSFVWAACFALAACSPAQQQHLDHDVAFTHVDVIDVAGAKVLEDRTILVEGDRIVGVMPASAYKKAPGAMVIDGAGKFLMPGLADMHVHIRREDQLPLYVANGVTLVRDMWGSEEILKLRDIVQDGEIFAPSIVVGAPGLDGAPPTFPSGPSASNAQEAVSFVAMSKAAGYDFVKVYDRLSVDAFAAVASAAAENEMVFSGHAPMGIPIEDVLASGIASVEHGQGYLFAYLSEDIEMPEGPFNPQTHYPVLMREAAAAMSAGRDIGSLLNTDRRTDLARETASEGVWNTPTLVALIETNKPSSEREAAFARNEVKYLHPDQLKAWGPDNFRFQFLGDMQLEMLRVFAGETKNLVAELDAAGAGLLIGTDAPEAFVTPGFSVHQELALFVEAGLTPAKALAAATIGPAKFLGEEGIRGCIADGCVADLILLDANPLDAIENTSSISGVMLRGRWRNRDNLDQQLDELAASFNQ